MGEPLTVPTSDAPPQPHDVPHAPTVIAGDLPPGSSLPAVLQAASLGMRTVAFLEGCRRRFGDTFTVRIPGAPPIVSFSHPEAVKQIFTGGADALRAGESNAQLGPLLGWHSLLLLDGGRHLAERRLMMPPFQGERMHAYAEVMLEVTDQAIDGWPHGRAFAFQSQMQAITLDVILRTVFGLDDGGDYHHLRERLQTLVGVAANPLWLIPWLRFDLGPLLPWTKLVRTRQEVERILFDEFGRRRAMDRGGRTDVLSTLLDARYEDGRGMTDAELRDEMITLLLAGHETTATALAWATYHVLRTPRVLARIRAELDAVVGSGELRAEHLPRLEYLDAVIKEALRINPVLDDVGRLVKQPMEIGGWRVPAGVIAAPQIYLVHHRADLWPDPYVFDPERFVGRRMNPYEFLPFGGGARRCIGMGFALYEMKIVLARVFTRTQLRLVSRKEVRAVRRAITLAPARGLRVVMD
jgi:cytochrome P450